MNKILWKWVNEQAKKKKKKYTRIELRKAIEWCVKWWVRALYFNLLRFVKSTWYNTHKQNRHFRNDNKNIYFRHGRNGPNSPSLFLSLSRLHIFFPPECGNLDISSLWLAIRFIFISHSKWINDGISEFYCVIHRMMCCSLHELCCLLSHNTFNWTLGFTLYVFMCIQYMLAWVAREWKQQHSHTYLSVKWLIERQRHHEIRANSWLNMCASTFLTFVTHIIHKHTKLSLMWCVKYVPIDEKQRYLCLLFSVVHMSMKCCKQNWCPFLLFWNTNIA